MMKAFMKDNDRIGELLSESLRAKLENFNLKKNLQLTDQQIKFEIADHTSSMAEIFLSTSAHEIATQLVVKDWSMLKTVSPKEFLDQAWSKNKLKYRAPNILKLIRRSNEMSMWVPTIILWHSNLAVRAKAVSKFINIGEYLLQYNDYTALMAIIAGLNLSSIGRLNFTMSAVNDKEFNSKESFQNLVDPSHNWKNFRSHISSANRPLIPYLGMYLSDLIFIDEGNQNMIKKKINFNKRQQIYTVLEEIRNFQQGNFDFQKQEPLYTFINELPALNESDLYNLSLVREPRGSQIFDL
eukprot:TRINITY_DN9944_c0_g1_i1.p1 TRINITY_DN9944_c0_g1~~TRINITY_DN9944_c0_g1_i1.p1  ORF type:complete len:297 (+),score=101.06 TRINITY_DN9944_c0_g1_i1:42-932(+)